MPKDTVARAARTAPELELPLVVAGEPEDAQLVLGEGDVAAPLRHQVLGLGLGVEDEAGVQVHRPRADHRVEGAEGEALELGPGLDAVGGLGRRLAAGRLDVEGEPVRADREDRARREGAGARIAGEEAAEATLAVASRIARGAEVDRLAELEGAVDLDAGRERPGAELVG